MVQRYPHGFPFASRRALPCRRVYSFRHAPRPCPVSRLGARPCPAASPPRRLRGRPRSSRPSRARSRSRATSPSTSRCRRRGGAGRGPRGGPVSHLRGRPARLAVREQADHPEPGGRGLALHAPPRRHERERHRGGNREAVVQAAATFTDRVEKSQKVAIYAFDGSADLHPIVPFTDSDREREGGRAAARDVQAAGPEHEPQRRGRSRPRRARQRARQSEHPLKFGTLVVFTDGTDRAARVPAEEMQQHVREKPLDVFAIGLGAEIKESQLRTSARAAPRWPRTRRRSSRRSTRSGRASRRDEELLPPLLLLARARGQARGADRGRREAGNAERDRQPAERLRRDGLRRRTAIRTRRRAST